VPTTLRRLPLPVAEPPYDDDTGGSEVSRASALAPTTQGTLALAFVLPSGVPAHPRLRLVPAPHRAPAPSTDSDSDTDTDPDTDPGSAPESDDGGPRATPRRALPDPRPWAGRFVQALVEVLGGARPATQLVRWTTSEVYADIQLLASAARVDSVRCDAVWPPGPRSDDTCVAGALTTATRTTASRTSTTARPVPAVRGLVRSIHVGEPADGVAEICALVQRGPRASAVALRLEGLDGRWKCTALALP
jgi:hypothetical protein